WKIMSFSRFRTILGEPSQHTPELFANGVHGRRLREDMMFLRWPCGMRVPLPASTIRGYDSLASHITESLIPATSTRTLVDRYTAEFAGSKQRFETAKGLFPCGVTHDARMMEPFPVYITHAKGSHKWDVDGHKLTDYFVGHGSHLLGHCPDDVVTAVQEQMAR